MAIQRQEFVVLRILADEHVDVTTKAACLTFPVVATGRTLKDKGFAEYVLGNEADVKAFMTSIEGTTTFALEG